MKLDRIGAALVLVAVFLMNFLSRWIYSPLLLPMREDLGLELGQMGSLFLFITVGYATAVLFSGYFAERFLHRGAIMTAAFGSGLVTLALSFAGSLWGLRIGLAVLGIVTGLYMSSAMSSLTTLAPREHWGKVLALHEIAPIVALLSAPLIVNTLLNTMDWRSILRVLSLACLATALLLIPNKEIGRSKGEAPGLRHLRELVTKPQFWLMFFGFATAIGSEVGTYAVLPTYLVAERGLPQVDVNRYVGFSRMTAFVAVMLSGQLRDRLGDRIVVTGVLGLTGVLTLLLGVAQGTFLIVVVFLQPSIMAAYFPAALAEIAGFSPAERRNVTFSLLFPAAYLLGAGVFPTVMGHLGEAGRFALGFVALGCWSLLVALLGVYGRALPRRPKRKASFGN
jgi:NNP family nitrate/nitrite transporter-like MFS transporter